METHKNVETASELFKAQVHIYKHAFGYASAMALNCAIQLGIPDIIHNHRKPITLPDLVSALKLPSSKSVGFYQLMRLLVHTGFFDIIKLEENLGTEGYVLTTSSRLLLKSEIPNLSPVVRVMVDPVSITPWQLLGEWFRKNEEATAFETAHGMTVWDYCAQNPRYERLWYEGVASGSQMMTSTMMDYCREVFKGLNSMVDVGGGTRAIAKTILEAFPHLKCTVLDLPHVVANMPQSENLRFVGGNMFQTIPHGDAILLKQIMHDWSDEDCVKILKRCIEAIKDKDGGRKGKVLIIDMVLNIDEEEADITEVKLINDVLMMVLLAGRERTEKEWERLFLEAGFKSYKITPLFGLRSLIQVFP